MRRTKAAVVVAFLLACERAKPAGKGPLRPLQERTEERPAPKANALHVCSVTTTKKVPADGHLLPFAGLAIAPPTPHDVPDLPAPARPREPIGVLHVSCARGEFHTCQLVVWSEKPGKLSARATRLAREGVALASDVELFWGCRVPISEGEETVDPMVPFNREPNLEPGRAQPVYVRVNVPRDAAPGVYWGEIDFTREDDDLKLLLSVDVRDFALPRVMTRVNAASNWMGWSLVQRRKGSPPGYYNDPKYNFGEAPYTDAYVELVKRFWRELRRGGTFCAVWTDVKKDVFPVGGDEGEGGLDFSKNEWFWKHVFAELGFPLLDVPFYYTDACKWDKDAKTWPLTARLKGRVAHYLSEQESFLREKGWLDRAYAQNYGDEPTQLTPKTGHSHPSYEVVRAWSRAMKAGAPNLAVSIAENPVPQLWDAIDVWVSMWMLAKGADRDELVERNRKLGRPPARVLAYSCETNVSDPQGLLAERAISWGLFAEGLDGAWSWRMYEMGSFDKVDARRRRNFFYPGPEIGVIDRPVSSLRLEMFGEGSEDAEYLQLLADKFSVRMARSLARLVDPREPGFYDFGRHELDHDGIERAREFAASLLERPLPAWCSETWSFESPGIVLCSEADFDEADYGWRLAYSRPPVKACAFDAASLAASGAVHYELVRRGGRECAKLSFKRGEADHERMDFEMRCNVTDWSGYDWLEMDIFPEGPAGLFDLVVSLNDDVGLGYARHTHGSSWSLPDIIGHPAGMYSINGTLPGKWRRIVVNLNRFSEKRMKRESRKDIRSLRLMMGRWGSSTINEPLPDVEYFYYVRAPRLVRREFVKEGEVNFAPRAEKPVDTLEWIARVPEGCSIDFECFSGGDRAKVKKESEFSGTLERPLKGEIQIRAKLRSDGEKTPVLFWLSLR